MEIISPDRAFFTHENGNGGALARGARSGAPWVRKNGNQKMREILVITWPSVRPSTPLHVSHWNVKFTTLSIIRHRKWQQSVNYNHRCEDESTASIEAESFFFRLNFNVYTDMDSRERARERDKETKETNFVGRKTWKFYSGCENITNTSGHKYENERQWKKRKETLRTISL